MEADLGAGAEEVRDVLGMDGAVDLRVGGSLFLIDAIGGGEEDTRGANSGIVNSSSESSCSMMGNMTISSCPKCSPFPFPFFALAFPQVFFLLLPGAGVFLVVDGGAGVRFLTEAAGVLAVFFVDVKLGVVPLLGVLLVAGVGIISGGTAAFPDIACNLCLSTSWKNNKSPNKTC